MSISTREQKTVLIGVLVILLLVSICLLGVMLWSSASVGETKRAPAEFGPIEVQDRVALEGNTETVIPDSANGIRGVIRGFQGITTHLRFDIPAAALDDFIQSTGCSEALTSTADVRALHAQMQGPRREWWAPEKAQSYASCNGDKEHLAQLVFVDMTDPQRYVVYVIVSTR